MFRVKSTRLLSLVLVCFSVNIKVFSVERGFEEKMSQYNGMLEISAADMMRIQASESSKDNLAAIRVGGNTFFISSSIINGFLVRDTLPSGDTRAEAEVLYPPTFHPVSVMDLLYMYSADYTGLVEGSGFQAKVDAARASANRKLIERMIKMHPRSKLVFKYRLRSFIDVGDPDLAMQGFLGSVAGDEGKNARLLLLKNAIIDFIHRLRQYANEIAFIPAFLSDQCKESHHLLSDKESLTKLDVSKQLSTTTGVGNVMCVVGNNQLGALEQLISKIDVRILHDQYRATFSKRASARLGGAYAPSAVNVDNMVDWMTELYKLISGPWNGNLGGAAGSYVRAITHTEQMVDWISSKFEEHILVKISGKAPCLKCSHYIQYAGTGIDEFTRVVGSWNARAIIGFNTGWRDGDESEINEYRYPVKVFNADPEGNVMTMRFRLSDPSSLLPIVPGEYSLSQISTGPGYRE